MNTIRKRRIFTGFVDFSSLNIIGLPGTENRIVKFSSTGLTSSSLFDDGSTVAMDSGNWFTGESGDVIMDFGTTGSPIWSLSRDGSTAGSVDYTTSWIYGDATTAQIGFGTISRLDATVSQLYGIAPLVAFLADAGTSSVNVQFNSSGTIDLQATTVDGVSTISMSGTRSIFGNVSHHEIELDDNSVFTSSSGDVTKYATFIGTQNSTFGIGVINSVILGGTGLYAKTNNTAYLNQIGYATGATNETLLSFTAPTGARAIIFEDASGRVLAASAVTTESVASDRTLTVVFNGVSYKLLARA